VFSFRPCRRYSYDTFEVHRRTYGWAARRHDMKRLLTLVALVCVPVAGLYGSPEG
jgi:hypothetical protein